MKHPALTKTLAAVLAVMCLITLLSGCICIKKAGTDKEEALRLHDLLSERTESAKELTEALELSEDEYDLSDAELQKLVEKHNEESSKYKSDLAVFTATKAGLEMGRGPLDEGIAAMAAAWQQYYDGEKQLDEAEEEFNKGYEQFLQGKKELEAGWEQYYQAEALAAALDIPTIRKLISTLSDTISSGEQTAASLKERISQLNGGGEISPENAARLEELDAQIAQAQAELDALNAQTISAQTLYNNAKDDFEKVSAALSEALKSPSAASLAELIATQTQMYNQRKEEMENALAGLNTVSARQLELSSQIQTLKAERLSIASQDGGNSVLLSTLEAQLAEQERNLASQRTQLEEYEAQLAMLEDLPAMKAQLEEAQKMLDENEAAIEQGKTMFEEGRKQLKDGKKTLDDAQAQLDAGYSQFAEEEAKLDKTESELKDRKSGLKDDINSIEDLTETVESYEDTMAKYTNVKALLMANDDVSAGVENDGLNLIESADKAVELAQQRLDDDYSGRIRVAVLMILASVLAVPAIYAAFSDRFPRCIWPFTTACAALAVLSEIFSFSMGRGMLYTSLFVFIFALPVILLNLKNA